MTEGQDRVCCLYRVSTEKQVDHNDNNEADIPMQRKACHRFAESKGWKIVHEEQEEGVSGHKVHAADRDKLQIIRDLARQKKFDILLAFMFDRIGRIASETPFVVEWFVSNGIRVWSTQEGEQRFDNHTDKLLNYIRFWQADGESEKTSIRTRTSLGQLVEDGHYKGGHAAYGYDLVKSGRVNKKKHELYDLKINESEAAVVRLIFNKYTVEGYGAQRIATYLNEHGYRNRDGEKWHPASINGMLHNLTYTGVLRSGESRSPLLEELQIISAEQYETAQSIRAARSGKAEAERTAPLNTRGQSLLCGNIYCGHCGARLVLTTSGKHRRRADGSIDDAKRIRYVCYGKTRSRTACDGPTGYTQHKLDAIVDKLLHDIFFKMKGVSRDEVIRARCEAERTERQTHLAALRTAYAKELAELNDLKAEVIRAIRGESAFTAPMLSGLIAEAEEKCAAAKSTLDAAEEENTLQEQEAEDFVKQYDEIISWADLYDTASMATKKMIVSCLIRRIDVYRDYRLHVTFNMDVGQFIAGLDYGA